MQIRLETPADHAAITALIHHALAQLGVLSANGCIVLGDLAYYPRFGFRPEPALRYTGPPPEYCMALALSDTPMPSGAVHYAPAFKE